MVQEGWGSWPSLERVRYPACMALEQYLGAYILVHTHEAKRSNWELHGLFELSKPIPPPIEPHLLILPKQFHQLGTTHSNMWACGGHSHSNYHITSITFMPRSHQWYVLVFVSKVFVVAHRVHTFLRLTIVFLLWWCVHDNFQQYGT